LVRLFAGDRIYNIIERFKLPEDEPMVRADENDLIYKNKEAKYRATIADITERHDAGQPILVGTISVEVSEHLSQHLTRQGIPHNVLNAKQHEREAEIIKDAGQPGAVTIATNMAGRGVDIKLGDGVRELGGLYVLGTERHESRRIDNQLRGRSGRQGDPGESRFYLSAEDDLVRLFAGDRIYNIIERFKLPEDEPMEAAILSKQIENAQKKVEEQNFVARKNVLKYDDVMNVQRQVIYAQRRAVLEGEDLSEEIGSWIDGLVEAIVLQNTESDYQEEWDLPALLQEMESLYTTEIKLEELQGQSLTREELVEEFQEDARDAYAAKEEDLGPELTREIERFLILQVVDARWREHLDSMEYLREGIHLRAMAQKDPLSEYRAEGHTLFEELTSTIREEVLRYLFHVELEREEAERLRPPAAAGDGNLVYEHESLAGSEAIMAAGAGEAAVGGAVAGATAVATAAPRVASEWDRVGRNDPCPCGSGKKFKKCHGA
ncbi:MAG: SEC-C domain-containing protein, partial [Actinobacteria bacterium]|nr:SEC-C domain-containing protein [Actinomycetota bacterium]